MYTPAMTLKSAALLALIGMGLLTLLLVATLLRDAMAVASGILPGMSLLASMIHTFAALSAVVFLYVFRKAQG